MSETIFWHDYETWGANPSRDRPAQFAGVRTDLDLNIIDEPLVVFCRPSDDVLPHPEACLITGITPQKATQEGVSEAEFIARIHHEMAQPGTCVAGYNSIRFDDEVTRYTLYRNFFDPYAREWKNGNSRWDIIDMVRLTYALRPDGINWPLNDDGVPSFRLEELTAANGIAHEAAHDAMSDVHATIALARLIREKQPRLYDYVFQHRGKRSLAALVDVDAKRPLFHVSSRYPASIGCCAMVVPLAMHPTNPNGVIVYDLRQDPADWVGLTPEAIRERVFVARDELPVGVSRIPLKVVHLNKCPVLVESKILKSVDPARLAEFQLDGEILREHLQTLRHAQEVGNLVAQVFAEQPEQENTDPDTMLYSGGFFSASDREKMDYIRQQTPDILAELELPFQDPRIPEMLFRYRARNFPDTLTEEEMERWERDRYRRMTQPGLASITFEDYFNRIQSLAAMPERTPEQMTLLQDLQLYGESIIPVDF